MEISEARFSKFNDERISYTTYDVDVIDFYRLSLFFKNNNPQEFKGEDYQEHIFRDKTPDNIITIRSK